jgi:hypothetical protein
MSLAIQSTAQSTFQGRRPGIPKLELEPMN